MKKGKLTFLKPEKGNNLGQWLVEQGISAGFPSPADDFKEVRISLDKELVKNQESTFYARVSGDSMLEAGIDDGDLLVIDKSLSPENGKIAAVLTLDNEITLKKVKMTNQKIYLIPANKAYQIKEHSLGDVQIQGTLSGIIRKYN